MDWAKTTAREHKKHLNFEILCDLYYTRGFPVNVTVAIGLKHRVRGKWPVKRWVVMYIIKYGGHVNTLRPRQNRRHFADAMFKCIFLNENVWIPIEISLTFVPIGSINNIPALVQIMAWRRPGDKPLSEPVMVRLLTHICVTRPQCVKNRVFHKKNAQHTHYPRPV